MNSSVLVVLLVEDDGGDQKLIREALSAHDMTIDLHMMPCGEDALRYLMCSGHGDTRRPWPDLILLDLNMPGMGGKEFLKHAKTHSDMCGIPVVVLTTSASEVDIDECYEMHAAGYIQKPASPNELKEVIDNVVAYWRTSCLLAKGGSPDDTVRTAEEVRHL
jgi:CheY-like chemotaxis protein